MTRHHPRVCLLGVWMTTHNFKEFKPPKKPQKGAWLGIFKPNWQNYKIAISPAGKIGSTPNFDTVIKPHSWLCGWSRVTKFKFKMADGRRIAKIWKRYCFGVPGATPGSTRSGDIASYTQVNNKYVTSWNCMTSLRFEKHSSSNV